MKKFFDSLTDLIKQHDKILIMTHKNIDLDGLGSSLCLYSIIKNFNKECLICLNYNKLNNSIKKSLKFLKQNNINIDFINKSTLKKYNYKNALLIIIDMHKKEILEDEEILKKIKDIIVIDHHLVNNYDIKTKVTYIDPNISSTSEIMVNYLMYLNYRVDPMIATIMLSGIEVDTNGFKVKTSEGTYNAAAHLTNLGIDNIIKQEILKENKENYLAKQKYIEKSYMINEKISLCIIDDNIFSANDLASIAEELLQFENIEASFVIGRVGKNEIGISARSLGNVDVFKICKKLGGGGHFTNAATQIENKTILEVKKMLLNAIKEVK